MRYIILVLVIVVAGCSTPEDREWRRASEKLCRDLGGEPGWVSLTGLAGCDMSYIERE